MKGSFTDNVNQTREELKDHITVITRLTSALFIVMIKLRMKPKGGICTDTKTGNSLLPGYSITFIQKDKSRSES